MTRRKRDGGEEGILAAKIRNLAAEGSSDRETALNLGVEVHTVRRMRQKFAIPPAKQKHQRSIDHERVLRLFDAGCTYVEIAEEVGCTRQAARSIVLQHDGPPREPGPPTPEIELIRVRSGLVNLARLISEWTQDQPFDVRYEPALVRLSYHPGRWGSYLSLAVHVGGDDSHADETSPFRRDWLDSGLWNQEARAGSGSAWLIYKRKFNAGELDESIRCPLDVTVFVR